MFAAAGFWLAIAVVAAAILLAIVAAIGDARAKRSEGPANAVIAQTRDADRAELRQLDVRVRAVAKRFTDATITTPVDESDDAHRTAAAAIDAALCASDLDGALAIAESALSAAKADAGAQVQLAYVLIASGEPRAAAEAIERARAIGATGPMIDFVVGRAQHLAYEQAAGATGPVPPLVTAVDLLALTLGRGENKPTWLHSPSSDHALTDEQIRELLTQHATTSRAVLESLLEVCEARPGLVDAVYFLARVAIKCGLVAQGRELLEAAAPRMIGRPDHGTCIRDLVALEDPEAALSQLKLPATPKSAKRSVKLRVL